LVAGKHSAIADYKKTKPKIASQAHAQYLKFMIPTATILQLDTHFPRVPGDVASADTYLGDVEIIRIPSATVAKVVSERPDLIDITPFDEAIVKARGEVIVTSCGFLSYWQQHLQQLTAKPFISSALIAFKQLSERFTPDEVLTLTYDKNSLTKLHFGEYIRYANETIGLPTHMHLRRVISQDLSEIDVGLVADELTQFISSEQRPQHKHLVLECTNLPPYKAHLQNETGLGITDILTCIEAVRPGTVHSQFLT